MSTGPLFEGDGAIFSACRRYRFRLWRTWDPMLPTMMFLGLNPSTADETANDPTIERCVRRAREYGFGRLFVGNIFALRSTDPAALYTTEDPVGRLTWDEDNNRHLRSMARASDMILCGWGKHGAHLKRGQWVKYEIGRIVLNQNRPQREWKLKPLHVLRLNKDGTPQHPLYVGYDVKPTRWEI